MKKNILFILVTIILLSFILFFSRETVQAQKECQIRVDSVGHKQLEKEHEKRVKQVLNTHNILNSGVMMTKIIYSDGRREYTVKINNRAIHQMSVVERAQLMEELEKITFPLPNGTCIYQFLEA